MSSQASLESLGQQVKLLRAELIGCIEHAQVTDRALKVAVERATQNLPEFAVYQAAKSDVISVRKEYDSAVAAYRAEQAIASYLSQPSAL